MRKFDCYAHRSHGNYVTRTSARSRLVPGDYVDKQNLDLLWPIWVREPAQTVRDVRRMELFIEIETDRRDLPSNRARASIQRTHVSISFHFCFELHFSDDENDRRARTIDNFAQLFLFCSLTFGARILAGYLHNSRSSNSLLRFFVVVYENCFVIPSLCHVRMFLICYCFAICARNNKENVRESINGIFSRAQVSTRCRTMSHRNDGFATRKRTEYNKQISAKMNMCLSWCQRIIEWAWVLRHRQCSIQIHLSVSFYFRFE